jgi:hypothetical protein
METMSQGELLGFWLLFLISGVGTFAAWNAGTQLSSLLLPSWLAGLAAYYKVERMSVLPCSI